MSAQRASVLVRFAGLAAAAVIIILAAVVALRLAGRRGEAPPTSVEPPPEDRVVDLKERVRHQEYREGKPVVDIRGERFSRGPDGRNHLAGSVEIEYLDLVGKRVSRIFADEVVYDPGSLRFTVAGHVRVEAGGVVLEGASFDYDKTRGLFETTAGGRFSSKALSGSAPEIAYTEIADEVRLGGGFRAEIAEAGGKDRSLAISGEALVYVRRERRGRVDGRAALENAEFKGASAAASFVASRDERSLESAVFEGAARLVFDGREPQGEGSGEIRADRIAIAFVGDPPGLFSIETSGHSRLSLRSAADRTETVLAPTALLKFDRTNGLWTWSASGGIRAEITDAGGPRRTLEGETAVFDAAGVLGVSGGPGRPAVADSAEARIEAPKVLVASAAGDLLASGGVACVLKRGQGTSSVGFFSPRQDVSVSSERIELRPGISTSLFIGNVLVRQGTDTLRAGELELTGDMGRMSSGGGVAVTLAEVSEGQIPARTIEIGGQDMVFRPDEKTLTLNSKAYVRLPEARLEASALSVVIGAAVPAVESLVATGDIVVSKGRYGGRAKTASYQAVTRKLTLTGSPVLTDGKGGSAKGGKLTFDLADDKILIENEGPGRATTVVRS